MHFIVVARETGGSSTACCFIHDGPVKEMTHITSLLENLRTISVVSSFASDMPGETQGSCRPNKPSSRFKNSCRADGAILSFFLRAPPRRDLTNTHSRLFFWHYDLSARDPQQDKVATLT